MICLDGDHCSFQVAQDIVISMSTLSNFTACGVVLA